MHKKIAFLALMFGIAGTMGISTISNASASEGLTGGHIELVKHDADGNITQYVQTDNFITDDGFDCMANYLFGAAAVGSCNSTATFFTTVGLGTSTQSGATNYQTLATVNPDANCDYITDGEASFDSGTTNQKATVSVQIGGADASANDVNDAHCQKSFTEAGLFNSQSPGDMFAYQTFTSITIGASDTLTVTWDIVFS